MFDKKRYNVEDKLLSKMYEYESRHNRRCQRILIDAFSFESLVNKSCLKATDIMDAYKNPMYRDVELVVIEAFDEFIICQRKHPSDVIYDTNYHYQKEMERRIDLMNKIIKGKTE